MTCPICITVTFQLCKNDGNINCLEIKKFQCYEDIKLMLWFNEIISTVSKPQTVSLPPPTKFKPIWRFKKAKGYSDAIWNLRKTKKVDN